MARWASVQADAELPLVARGGRSISGLVALARISSTKHPSRPRQASRTAGKWPMRLVHGQVQSALDSGRGEPSAQAGRDERHADGAAGPSPSSERQAELDGGR